MILSYHTAWHKRHFACWVRFSQSAETLISRWIADEDLIKTVLIFKTVVFILLTVVFILLTFFLHPVKVVGQAASSTPQVASVSPVVVSSGWPVKAFVLNNLGTVVFAGGQNPFSVDGIVIVNSEKSVKFVTVGDSVPGFENKVFVGFLSNAGLDPSYAGLSLNDRDEVAFSGAFMTCPDVSNVYQCLSGREQVRYGLFVYSRGKISK